jgi:hypothetical protein
LVWPDQGSNPRSIALDTNTITITLLMLFKFMQASCYLMHILLKTACNIDKYFLNQFQTLNKILPLGLKDGCFNYPWPLTIVINDWLLYHYWLTSHNHLLSFTFTADRFTPYVNERTTCICICYEAKYSLVLNTLKKIIIVYILRN